MLSVGHSRNCAAGSWCTIPGIYLPRVAERCDAGVRAIKVFEQPLDGEDWSPVLLALCLAAARLSALAIPQSVDVVVSGDLCRGLAFI